MLDDAVMDEEPTDEEILESIRRGMQDVKAGRTRPARQAIAEIRSKLAADADARSALSIIDGAAMRKSR